MVPVYYRLKLSHLAIKVFVFSIKGTFNILNDSERRMNFFILLTPFLLASCVSATSKGCFRAAAYEHVLVGYHSQVDRKDPLKDARENLKAFAMAAEAAKDEDAKIIVFPEDGIFLANRIKGENSTHRDGCKLLAEDVPDPLMSTEPIVPCKNNDFDSRPILQTLSCIAAKNKIYVVADMADIKNCSVSNITNCHEDGLVMYNTQVAFDRKGSLVGRYHKYHLYGEFHYATPDKQELIYFDTDFGARVGMYVCFDRLFHDPMVSLVEDYNVTTMALSTWFFDEYPFLISHQIDQAWSIGLGINIVSANSKHLKSGTTGSGLFSPSYVAISEHDIGKNTEFTRPKLLVANLPVDPRGSAKCDPDPWSIGISKFKVTPGEKYTFYSTNFSIYDSVKLTEEKNDNVTLCQGDFCCTLKYQMKKKSGKHYSEKIPYYFAVANRLTEGYYESKYKTYHQVCLLVLYDDENSNYPMNGARHFKSIGMKGSFDTDYVYPTALTNNFNLLPTKSIKLKSNGNERELSLKVKQPILMAGLYGRVYDRDRPYVQSEFGNTDGKNPITAID